MWRGVLTAGELLDVAAVRWELGFVGQQNGDAVADREQDAAASAAEVMVTAFEGGSPLRIDGATQNFSEPRFHWGLVR